MEFEPNKNRRARMADLVAANPHLAPGGVMEIGFMVRDFLEKVVADAGTSVDTGCGFDAFDLWVKVDGEEYLLCIKKNGRPKPPIS